MVLFGSLLNTKTLPVHPLLPFEKFVFFCFDPTFLVPFLEFLVLFLQTNLLLVSLELELQLSLLFLLSQSFYEGLGLLLLRLCCFTLSDLKITETHRAY